MRLIARSFGLLLDLLAPPCCACCAEPCSSRQAFCAACGSPAAPSTAEPLVGLPVAFAGDYSPPLSTAIQRFKYQGHAELCTPLARLLAPALNRLVLPPETLLVPVPLHPRRLAERGYNQAGLLASALARQSGHACRPRLLLRARDTEHQVGMRRRERLENLNAAFQLRQPTSRSVVLVDDVITTGSTARQCLGALAEGGVRVVAVVALACAGGD